MSMPKNYEINIIFITPPGAMEASMIYTRAYSSNSDRRLVSGKGQQLPSLDEEYPFLCPSSLELEFRNHCKRWSKLPTALVSTSSRILDTIKRAYELWQDGEDAESVWVVFIETPWEKEDMVTRIHHAEALAAQYGHPRPKLFHYEFLFEWTIPRRWVKYKVSLETLMDRGLDWAKYFLGPKLTSSSNMGNLIKKPSRISLDDLRREELSMTQYHETPWDIGLSMGCITKCFGARAPLGWITKQLFIDLFRPDYS
ncbi:hypothetical protein PGQ11_007571 [Apiospora arundinis]|uniref:DUF7587 domain-containing protein n=1 Tax=Apiospora arundinis TaxID=335852 RepID=A0ABR2IVY1_9PEZI